MGCDQSVCLSFCLSACLSARKYQKTTRLNSTKFSVHVTRGSGSVLLQWQFNVLCTSGFMDGIMFSRNVANEPESKNANSLLDNK